MRVAVERSLGVAVLGLVTSEVPDDQSLVSGSGQEHVGARGLSVYCIQGDVFIRDRMRSEVRTSPWKWPSW